LPINSENSDINEDATLYNNSANDITTTITSYGKQVPINVYRELSIVKYLGANIQGIVRESIAIEAVDNVTYHVGSIDIEIEILLNYNNNEENEQIVNSEIDSYMNDEDDLVDDAETSLDSDSEFYTNSETGSNDDHDEDDQTDDNDNDDDSINDNDEISLDNDSGYNTNNELDSVNDNSEDGSIDENNQRSLSSDSGCETNSEDNSINDNDERSLMSDISYEMNNDNDHFDEDDQMSIITHITNDTNSEDDSIDDNDQLSVSIDSGFGTSNENDWSTDDDKTNNDDEVENNTPLDRTIFVVEQSVTLTLSSDLLSGQTLKIEENPDTLIDVDLQEMVSSTDPNGMDSKTKTNSIGLNKQLNEDSTSPQAIDDSRQTVLLDAETKYLQSNHGNNEEGEEIVGSNINLQTDDTNDHQVHSNIQRGRVSPSSEIPFNNDPNNVHFDPITTTDIQSAPQTLSLGSSSDQPLQIEQKPVDQTEGDHQNLVPSTHATRMDLEKHPNSVDSNEESSKKNVP
ncbi:unnamed protein product, partial [Rotaria sordida]